MKFHVMFQGSIWFLKFLISILMKILVKKPEGSGSVRHFVKIWITYPIHEEEMLKSKYFNDSLSDCHKNGTTGVIASDSVSLLVHRF